MANTENYVDTSALVSQNVVEMKAYVANPPDVDQVLEGVIGSTGSNGQITVKGISPARTALSFEFDLNTAGTWANTTGVFVGLSPGVHTIQARDSASPANVSVVLSLTVLDLS